MARVCPIGFIFRSKIHEQQAAASLRRRNELRDKGIAARINPVQVVEQYQRRQVLLGVDPIQPV